MTQPTKPTPESLDQTAFNALSDVDKWREYRDALQQLDNAEIVAKEMTRAFEETDSKLDIAVKALEFYASREPWTMEALEGNYGDWGNKARQALARISAKSVEGVKRGGELPLNVVLDARQDNLATNKPKRISSKPLKRSKS